MSIDTPENKAFIAEWKDYVKAHNLPGWRQAGHQRSDGGHVHRHAHVGPGRRLRPARPTSTRCVRRSATRRSGRPRASTSRSTPRTTTCTSRSSSARSRRTASSRVVWKIGRAHSGTGVEPLHPRECQEGRRLDVPVGLRQLHGAQVRRASDAVATQLTARSRVSDPCRETPHRRDPERGAPLLGLVVSAAGCSLPSCAGRRRRVRRGGERAGAPSGDAVARAAAIGSQWGRARSVCSTRCATARRHRDTESVTCATPGAFRRRRRRGSRRRRRPPPDDDNEVRRELLPLIAHLELGSPDRAVRLAAVQALAERGNDDDAPALRKALAREKDGAVRAALVSTLAELDLASARCPAAARRDRRHRCVRLGAVPTGALGAGGASRRRVVCRGRHARSGRRGEGAGSAQSQAVMPSTPRPTFSTA